MLIEWFMKQWSCPSPTSLVYAPELQPDVIIPLCYGTQRNHLARAGKEALDTAVCMWRAHWQGATIAYGNSDLCFRGSEKTEAQFKAACLQEKDVPRDRIVDAGAITNSITEAEHIKKALQERGVDPEVILLICTRMHSRAVRHIYHTIFPCTHITIVCIPGMPDVESDHQILLQRNPYVWVLTNIARQIVMRVMGLQFAKRITHPSAG